jgi:hypothetical protein
MKLWWRGMVFAAAAVTAPAQAQLFFHNPDFNPSPIEANDPLVGLPLPGATAAEYRAHLLWNLRSGLNVSALQCQFSPYLRTVSNYNGVLSHHSRELAEAYKSLTGYFTRVHGRQSMNRFDDYSTTTYNNFSTYQAQLGFCQVAASITRDALMTPKGQLHLLAQNRMRELRNSLTPAYDRVLIYNPREIRLHSVPRRPDCSQLRGRAKRQCEAAG